MSGKKGRRKKENTPKTGKKREEIERKGCEKDQGEEKKDYEMRVSMTEVSAGGLFDQGRAVVIWMSRIPLYSSVISPDSSKWIPEHLGSS